MGASIPLRQVADVELQAVPTQIDHFNLERTTTVTSYVENGYSDFVLTDQILEEVAAYDWPDGYRYFVAGKQEAQQESFSGMASQPGR